jgi:hypothetical protein
MHPDHLGPEAWKRLEQIAGYLNFSSGAEDPQFLTNLNALFGIVEHGAGNGEPDQRGGDPKPAWRALGDLIEAGVARLRGGSEAFREVDQAEAAVRLVFEAVLPAYRRHHRDLLFHQSDEFLFRPFFIGRVCEAVLAEGGPWEDSERIVSGALARLNDFLGYRPVPVLETRQKIQPYGHERVRPIPLFVAGAGAAVGPYREVIRGALEILGSTDRALLERAWFDPQALHELALDPRAYDFDHPVNRRPNYHFGSWDPHHIDNQGRYRRFVLQQVTLDALLTRLDERDDLPRDEVLFEAAAVLVGTMLMGSGITGSGPDAHDSSTTLATLLPVIASYRDAFYQQLLPRLARAHAKRLRSEAALLKQPFGGARQHLNQALARRRAEQLQHVHLARLFARMGYTEAAVRQALVVPVASARMRCEIDCRLNAAHLQIDRGELDAAAALVPEIEDLLHRAIECGAMVDPWNILGFAGQYSLFPAVENSIHDHRIDELVELVSELFALYARIEKEAAAAGRADLQKRLSANSGALARWWDQFGSTEVGGVEGISGRQAWVSAGQVASAIAAWHEAGTAAGDIAFWKEHVEEFSAPEAFALLTETLIERGDLVASMALLMLWLSRAEQIPLAEAEYSFSGLAIRWMEELWELKAPARADAPAGPAAASSPAGPSEVAEPTRASSPARVVRPEDRWPLAKKFFDYLEANADEYWEVPRLELVGDAAAEGADAEPADDDSEGLFSAAYENVTYRDTTDDGFEGEMLEGGAPATDFELALEADRISKRLSLLTTVARLWKLAAAASGASGAGGPRTPAGEGSASPGAPAEDRQQVLAGWHSQAMVSRRGLLELARAVHRYRIRPPSSALDAMVEYDRRRAIKDALLERIVAACAEMADAAHFLMAAMERDVPTDGLEVWEGPAREVLRAMFRGDGRRVRDLWPELLDALVEQPLLYVPPSRGGNPQRVIASRSVQPTLARLLTYAPRLGLLSETYQLLETIQEMERNHPVGPGAITEFDRLFEIGCRAICECVVVSSGDWRGGATGRQGSPGPAAGDLVDCLEQATQLLLQCWMDHSRNIRISVLETVAEEGRWRQLKKFVRSYGHDLFTQSFMNYGNLRAILHEGADAFFRSLEEEPPAGEPLRLLEDLDRRVPRDEAARWLEVACEAIVENYSEYIDYNSTTTQSDHGEMLYTLLDFLRLLASYDRVAWNMKPIVIAHEVLVRQGRDAAARAWRQAVAGRTAAVAEGHLDRFERLSKRYGMRLPSIAERLEERFVGRLTIDRLCALVRPAMDELPDDLPPRAFGRLEREVARFTREPSGVGFEVPPWLEALEEEVAAARSRAAEPREPEHLLTAVPRVRLSRQEAKRQLESWEEEA